MALDFYHGQGSPYSWRVWLALELKKIPSGPALYPGDAKERARIRRLAREAEEYLGIEGIDPITNEFFGREGAVSCSIRGSAT